MQGCSDPFDEYGNGGTEMPVRDGWTSVSMSVEGLGLRNPLTRSLTASDWRNEAGDIDIRYFGRTTVPDRRKYMVIA